MTIGTLVSVACTPGAVCQTYVRYQSTDNAGNSDPVTSKLVQIDKQVPTGSIVINSGNPAYTNSTSVTLQLTYADASGSGIQDVSYSDDGVFDTEPFEAAAATKAWMLPAGDGAKTVTYRARDSAANFADFTDSITLDTGPPAAPSAGLITITMNAPGVQDQITGAAGAVEGSATVKVCADGLCTGLLVQFAAAGDGSFTVQNIGDNQGDGSDLVYVFAVDAAGNTSAATSKPNDKTPPSAPTISSTTPTSPSATSTPTVSGGCDATATSVEVFDDGSLLGSGSCTASAFGFAPGLGVTLNASNTLTAKAVDAAGNVSVASTGFTYLHDNTAPSAIATVNDGTGADIAYQTSTTDMNGNWTSSADSGSGLLRYEFSAGSTPCGTEQYGWAANALSTTATAGALMLSNGTTYYFNARAVDNAGNIGACTASNGVIVDNALPTSSISTPTSGAKLAALTSIGGATLAEANGNPINISWSAGSDAVTVAGSLVYQICQTTAPGGCGAFTATYTTSAGAVTYTTPALTKNTTYTFVVRAQDEAGNADGNTTEKSDAAGGNLWATKAPMSTLRRDAGIAAVNGKIYVLGGSGGATLNQEYDPVANTWAAKASMTYGSTCLGAAAVNGRIYAIGGHNGTNEVATVEEYDLGANAWTGKTAMPTARYRFGGGVINGRIFAVGGYSVLTTHEVYVPPIP